MKRLPIFLLLISVFPLAAAQIETKQVLSKTYTIDRKYRSMEGPASSDRIYLGDPTKPELLWIVGVKTEMVGEDGKTPQLPELMCHVNVDLDSAKHQTLFKFKRPSATRLITLSQGMLGAQLPRGYGFPIASNEPLVLFTQVLNHNIEKPNNIKVRHRITFEYVRDKDLAAPLKPLFNLGASGMVLLDNLSATMQPAADAGAHGASCLLAPRAPNANGIGADYVDPTGRKLTGHWVVPPGHQENHSDITWFMNLQYDTMLHFAAVHLHPFARSLTLRDVTTGETVFIAKADNPRKGIGLDRVDTIISERGMPIYKNHKYELVSVYDNPTKQNADSMASVFMGLEDPEFVRPTPAQLASRASEHLEMSNTAVVVLRTTAGDIAITPLRSESPHTAREFLRLVRVGAYEGAKVTKIDKNGIQVATIATLSAESKAEVAGMSAEPEAHHEPGMLSMCRGSAGFTFMLAFDTTRDGKCTAFGRVGAGAAVLRAMSGAAVDADGKPATPITITKAELYETAQEAVSKLRVATK